MTGLLSLAFAFAVTARAAEPPPWLSQMDAVNISTELGRKIPGAKDMNIVPYPYDTNLHLWVTLIKPGEGEAFLVTIDEASGLVCLQYQNRNGCAATGSAKAQVDAAKARMASRSEARRVPAPDLDGLHIALLQAIGSDQATSAQAPADWYVAVRGVDGNMGDASPGVLAAVHIPNVHLMPGGAEPTAAAQTTTSNRVRYSIDTPLKRPDGNYDVAYIYYCGTLCAGSVIAVMSHDAQGWHVVTSKRQWIS
jgi:hypothetical protein